MRNFPVPHPKVLIIGARPAGLTGGVVVRIPKAYPIYEDGYEQAPPVIRFLEHLPNLQLIGRNGMHRYNNQDHSMLAGMLAVRNIPGANYDIWKISASEDYLEDGFVLIDEELQAFEESQPLVPAAMGGVPVPEPPYAVSQSPLRNGSNTNCR